MNPSSPPTAPLNPPPRLVDCRLANPAPVPASVTRGFPVDYARLNEVERLWGPARDELAAALRAVGEQLQNPHWRWPNKAVYHPPGYHSLVAVECEGQVQGMMAVNTLLSPSALTPGGWVVYVDYLEAAPWNYRIPGDRNCPVVRQPRFAGVGTLLIAEAARMSMGQTANGRVGLHALPQAEDFYRTRCGMTRVGPDPDYHDLVYFEYPDGVSANWLTYVGLSA